MKLMEHQNILKGKNPPIIPCVFMCFYLLNCNVVFHVIKERERVGGLCVCSILRVRPLLVYSTQLSLSAEAFVELPRRLLTKSKKRYCSRHWIFSIFHNLFKQIKFLYFTHTTLKSVLIFFFANVGLNFPFYSLHFLCLEEGVLFCK